MKKNKELIADITQWDINSWKYAIDFWERNCNFNDQLSALELGGREGGLSLWLALKSIKTICSDLNNTEKTALPLHQKYKIEHLITYKDINATNIPFKDQFDIIVFKSILGGIGYGNNKKAQEQTFMSIYDALKPGGKLLFAENLVASPFHQFFRKKFVKWGNEWCYPKLEDLDHWLKNFSKVKMECKGVWSTFGRNEKQRNLLSVIDKAFFDHITPKKHRYIVFGYAEK
jgi:SAM-dependent methyltransferase